MPFDITQRLSDATVGTLELYAVHIGRELGLYDTLDRHGPCTVGELAEQAGIHPRYAQEWLEQQAVAGYLAVDGLGGLGGLGGLDDPGARRFALPEAHRGALNDPIDGEHVAPFAAMVVGVAGVLDQVVEAFRTGGGVPYAHYGAHFRKGQGDINRPAFTSDLVKAWLPAVEGVADRLAGGGRLLDVGTGEGWSAIAVKSAWPAAQVIGVDLDEASITDARRNAQQAGADVQFVTSQHAGGAGIAELGPIDVAIVLEALHDMSSPAAVLASIRQALVPGGIVVIADEAVADTFTAPGDDLERMMYGWSVTHCLPASMVEQPSAAIGTAIRAQTVADLAAEAGFSGCEIVDVDAGFFRIYRLSA